MNRYVRLGVDTPSSDGLLRIGSDSSMAAQRPDVPRGGDVQKRDPGTIRPTGSTAAPPALDGDVLLVGDERCTARLFESWIGERFTVRTASTTERALTEVATETVDVVVVDTRWLRDSDSELLRQLRRTDEPCRTLLLVASAATAFRADHHLRLPADGEAVCNAISNVGQVRAYEQTIETLLSCVDRRRVLERNGERTGAEYRQVQRDIERLHTHLDDTLDDVEHRYVELISRRQHDASAEV